MDAALAAALADSDSDEGEQPQRPALRLNLALQARIEAALKCTREAMAAPLRAHGGVALGGVTGEKPRPGTDDAARFRGAVRRLRAEAAATGQALLLVTHGDAIGQAVELLTGQTVVDVAFCGWVAFEPDGQGMVCDGVTALTID